MAVLPFPLALDHDLREAMSPMQLPAKRELIGRMTNQSEETLMAMYEQYGALVYSVAYRVLNQAQDAEEVTQDVFMRVWENSHKYDAERGSFTAWLATIARNAAVDKLRKRRRREPEQGTLSMDASAHLWETTLLDDKDNDLRRMLNSAMSSLPREQQQTIQLAYFHGMSQREIAEYLNRPLGTVKSQIRLGMKRLRTIWFADEQGED